jgi:hypothetical protein
MALQDVFDQVVAPLDHAICLRTHWWRDLGTKGLQDAAIAISIEEQITD